MYTHKPILVLLRNQKQALNKYGSMLLDTLYRVSGEDYKKIEQIIQHLLIKNIDEKKQNRDQFFEKYLNYKKNHGLFASEYIVNYIEKEIFDADNRE
jgi:hypothetical protein